MRFPYSSNYYEILGVPPSADFVQIKRAYYRRAKDCHPDKHGGHSGKEAEFKLVVEAFDTLSDPVRRRDFDCAFRGSVGGTWRFPPAGMPGDTTQSVMDSVADDILEELVVGNTVPDDTSLQTLMLDLKRTARFCRFREARNHYYHGRMEAAFRLLQRATQDSPENILYHYYLGMAAIRHLRTALRIGLTREPPQRLLCIRRVLLRLRRQRPLFLRWLVRVPRLPPSLRPPEDDMRDEVARAMTRIERRRIRASRPRLPGS
jgi:hypothetical protein